MALTPKQEKFAQLVASGKTQADAYRGSYDASRCADSTIYEDASRLRATPEIGARIEQLKREAAEAAKITIQDHLNELGRLKEIALQNGETASAVKAEELRGKASGIYITKAEVTAKIEMDSVSDDELKRRIAELMANR